LLNPDYRDILSEFLETGVEFLVVGAYALAAHGLPRATGDIDLWIARSEENANRVLRALARFGAPNSGWTADDLQKPDMVFQIGVEPCRIDVLPSIGGVGFGDAWNHRLVLEMDGLHVPFVGREHLIASKEYAGRPQDRADVARLKKQTPKPSD
jgi:predicted nucleotidyltransferase